MFILVLVFTHYYISDYLFITIVIIVYKIILEYRFKNSKFKIINCYIWQYKLYKQLQKKYLRGFVIELARPTKGKDLGRPVTSLTEPKKFVFVLI